ncbi:MAG TPA: ATP-binding protein [Gammaproteobacteria bacterium]
MAKSDPTPPAPVSCRPSFLIGDGEMARRIREHSWSATTLGPIEQWPAALREALGICLQSSFPTAIYWGPELLLLYNDAWAPIAGDKHPQALGRPAAEVWSDIWHVIEPQLREVLQNGRGISLYDRMLPMQRGGRIGETYWDYSFTPILDDEGRVAGVFNQGHETTDRVFAARRRQAEVDRLRELFEQAPSGVAVLRGPTHVFEMANPAYMHLVGNRQILGKAAAEALPEVVDQGFIAVLDEVFRTGKTRAGHSISLMLQRTPGVPVEERVLDYVYQPIKSAAGNVTGILIGATDVTERARTEAALRRSEAALKEADRRKNEFLATLAHELRNPLAPLLNAARLIQLAGEADSRLRKAADIVVRQVQTMARLVDDLIDVSRITRGRIELRVQPVELETIIANAVEAARPLIAEKRHELEVRLPDHPIVIDGDPVRLSQALLNVVNNAARYTPPGGAIGIRAARDGDRVTISVTDNGIGIAPEALDDIFDLFTQRHAASEERAHGLGIGLNLARGFVALHGGELTARSEGPGRGSEFVLTLPARPDEPLGSDRPRGGSHRGETPASPLHPGRRLL